MGLQFPKSKSLLSLSLSLLENSELLLLTFNSQRLSHDESKSYMIKSYIYNLRVRKGGYVCVLVHKSMAVVKSSLEEGASNSHIHSIEWYAMGMHKAFESCFLCVVDGITQ